MKFVVFVFAFVSAVCGQAIKTPSKDDFRNEFDHLLIQTATSGMEKVEQQLLHLQAEINQLNLSKSKVEQEKIVREIETSVALIAGSHDAIGRELKRTDLNVLERFNFEDAMQVSKVLINDLKETLGKVKAVQTV